DYEEIVKHSLIVNLENNNKKLQIDILEKNKLAEILQNEEIVKHSLIVNLENNNKKLQIDILEKNKLAEILQNQ
ncbi:hypothetical protein V2I22_08090, partial [Campylobacter sp. CLAX-7218-21]|uniref:hypothetical protein n=1 Tax=Campylobacter devanensis TaxID=3161138 RepID=UPI002EA0CFD0|nr:hypothetical protein [Campylobacter sp. CLAX-7218-21]